MLVDDLTDDAEIVEAAQSLIEEHGDAECAFEKVSPTPMLLYVTSLPLTPHFSSQPPDGAVVLARFIRAEWALDCICMGRKVDAGEREVFWVYKHGGKKRRRDDDA